eukprot:TRINITY_DN10655_c0_g1_i2.p1 TRINITY_DN10655_c0_g1~~TRINITY_DN10655_c0_g1_i2.p1  ORF type:complete len:410 (-),score=69.74 TRINITY_DN10655_c0_g1_i2:155-1357(-)
MARVSITVIEVTNFRLCDAGQSSDLYCLASTGADFENPVRTSTKHKQAKHCPFNETLELPIGSSSKYVRVAVMDEDRGKRDDHVGMITIQISHFRDQRPHDEWYKLVPSGEIHLRTQIVNSSLPADEPTPCADLIQPPTGFGAPPPPISSYGSYVPHPQPQQQQPQFNSYASYAQQQQQQPGLSSYASYAPQQQQQPALSSYASYAPAPQQQQPAFNSYASYVPQQPQSQQYPPQGGPPQLQSYISQSQQPRPLARYPSAGPVAPGQSPAIHVPGTTEGQWAMAAQIIAARRAAKGLSSAPVGAQQAVSMWTGAPPPQQQQPQAQVAQPSYQYPGQPPPPPVSQPAYPSAATGQYGYPQASYGAPAPSVTTGASDPCLPQPYEQPMHQQQAPSYRYPDQR